MFGSRLTEVTLILCLIQVQLVRPQKRANIEQRMIDHLHPWTRSFSLELFSLKQTVVTLRNDHYGIVGRTRRLKPNRELKDLGTSLSTHENTLTKILQDSLGMTTLDDLISRPEAARTVTKQLEYLETRLTILKQFLNSEQQRKSRTSTLLVPFKNHTVYDLMRAYGLVRSRTWGILWHEDEQTELKEQSLKSWKKLAKEKNRSKVCTENKLCAIHDIAAVGNKTLFGTFYFRNTVKHFSANGKVIGQLSIPWKARGVTTVNQTHVIVGLPSESKAIIIDLRDPMRIVSDIYFDEGCGVDIVKVEDFYVVGCDGSPNLKFYDSNWNYLTDASSERSNRSRYDKFHWIAYNRVSRLLHISDGHMFVINRQKDTVFTKGGYWLPLDRPLGVAVDSEGNWYTAGLSNKILTYYFSSVNRMGYFIEEIGGWFPADRVFGIPNYRKYVNSAVAKFSVDGTFQGQITNIQGSRGLAPFSSEKLVIANEYGEIQFFSFQNKKGHN